MDINNIVVKIIAREDWSKKTTVSVGSSTSVRTIVIVSVEDWSNKSACVLLNPYCGLRRALSHFLLVAIPDRLV